MKEDTRVSGPWQFGDDTNVPESAGARTDMINIKRKICSGASILSIADDEETFSTWARYERSLLKYKRMKSTKRMWNTEIITLIGDTGTGKTKWAYDQYPDLYSVPPKGTQTWFDDYDEHDIVLIDEIYGNRFSHGGLLQLLDRYPMCVPTHGSSVNFAPHTIILTSNAEPYMWYSQDKFPYAGGPLERRLTTNGSRIYRVDPGGVLELLAGQEPVVFGPIINPDMVL